VPQFSAGRSRFGKSLGEETIEADDPMTVTYPVRVPRSPKRGQSARAKAERARYNDDAEAIEQYINDDVKTRGPGEHMIAYDTIRNAIGVPYSRLCDLLGPLGGGNTAITVRRSE
jgi:hypothetical protein